MFFLGTANRILAAEPHFFFALTNISGGRAESKLQLPRASISARLCERRTLNPHRQSSEGITQPCNFPLQKIAKIQATHCRGSARFEYVI